MHKYLVLKYMEEKKNIFLMIKIFEPLELPHSIVKL